MMLKKILLFMTLPFRFLFASVNRKIIKYIYSKDKTLKHDIHSDFRARALNGLHQLFVGKIPQPFFIHNNQVKFYSDGGLMSIQAYYVGEIEYHQIKYLLDNHIVGDMVFLDIGGHHGAFAVLVAQTLSKRKLNGQIFTFEPDQRNIEFIEKNLKANSIHDSVTIIPCAVSDKNGIGRFIKSSDNSCNWLEIDSSFTSADSTSENIQMVSIDEYCKEFDKVDVIKMDIQGGELLALKGAETIIKKFMPVIFVEIMDYSSDSAETKAYLKSLNYELFYLSKSSKLLEEGSKEIFISWDVVAIFKN